jgi:nucleotide-binding universal stress UspA family protein
MGYSSLMVHVDDIESANARIALACDLAELFNAGLIGISGIALDTPIIDPYTGGVALVEVWAEEERIAVEAINRAEGRFRRVAGGRRCDLAWRGATHDPAELIAVQARASDLIILGRDSELSRSRAPNPGDVLMTAGRPLLVSPPDSTMTKMLAHILVAWKDSRESRRALADALPLLGKAGKITVIGIAEGGDERSYRDSVEDVANFIRRHKADATALVVSSNGQSAGDLLLAYARDNRVGLIVLGGYGHARAREWMFGGVTRSLLRTSPICCLFSH